MKCAARFLKSSLFLGLVVVLIPVSALAQHYNQTNLVSDIMGMAPVHDPRVGGEDEVGRLFGLRDRNELDVTDAARQFDEALPLTSRVGRAVADVPRHPWVDRVADVVVSGRADQKPRGHASTLRFLPGERHATNGATLVGAVPRVWVRLRYETR